MTERSFMSTKLVGNKEIAHFVVRTEAHVWMKCKRDLLHNYFFKYYLLKLYQF